MNRFEDILYFSRYILALLYSTVGLYFIIISNEFEITTLPYPLSALLFFLGVSLLIGACLIIKSLVNE